jgi:hypothetical protein
MEMDDSVYLLYADDVVVGVYRDAMLADKDMVLCRQGDMHEGRTPAKYYVRRMSIIREV